MQTTEIKTSEATKNELDKVNERLTETRESLRAAEQNAQQHVEAVAKTGDAGALDDLAVAENLVGVLRRVCAELEAQQSALSDDLAAAQAKEARAAALEKLGALASQANAEYSLLLKEREKFSATIRTRAEKLCDTARTLYATQENFIQTATALAPDFARQFPRDENIEGINQLAADLQSAGIDLEGVSANWSGYKRSAIDRDISLPKIEFGQEIGNLSLSIARERAQKAREARESDE